MPRRPQETGVTSQDSGITSAGEVTQNAGRDAAGRDIIYNIRNFLNGSSDEARYWSNRRATEQRRRLAAKIRIEYKERLEQVQGQARGYPRAKLRTAPEAIPDRLDFIQAPRQAASVTVPQHTSILQIYQERQSLLVLGEPGSGKTTLLLDLAVQMLLSKDDLLEQVPVMVPLSTWERRGRKARKGPLSSQLTSWLAELLEELYKVPRWLGLNWLTDGHLILLLDGLDEIVIHSERSSFLAAMNEYVAKYSTNVVLSCRLAEYKAVELKAELERAVVIQALEADDVLEFVGGQGTAYRGLAESLTHDAEMLKLCTSPLFLSMLMFAYPLQSAERLTSQSPGLNTRARLLRAYVDERFNQALLRGDPVSLPFIGRNKERSLKWLSWLSRNLAERSQADFLLERMQPNWLPGTGAFLVRLCLTLILFPIILLYVPRHQFNYLWAPLYVGVLAAFFGFAFFPQGWDVHWSLRTALVKWRLTLALSIGGGAAGLLVIVLRVASDITYFTIWPFGFNLEKYLTGAVIGAVFGAITGIIVVGFTGVVTESKQGSYESVISSLWTGCWVFSLSGIAIFSAILLIYKIAGSEKLLSATPYFFFNLSNAGWDQALHVSLTFALLMAYFGGWGFVFAHMILRFWIAVWGVGPGRYVRWLNAMVQLRLMYRSGAGFVFMHRILQEFLQSRDVSS